MRNLGFRFGAALVSAAVLALMSAAPINAEAPAAKKAVAELDAKDSTRSIILNGLVFPVFDANGKLLNYIYVNGWLLAAPDRDIWKIRERAHFIRDAMLRAAHRTSFGVDNDPTKLDEKRAEMACVKAANEALGDPGATKSMAFTEIASQGLRP